MQTETERIGCISLLTAQISCLWEVGSRTRVVCNSSAFGRIYVLRNPVW